MTTFIGVDGEGLTRADGTHDYTLLAASDGTYRESYLPGGLGTEECLEFLLDVSYNHPDDIVCGFYTSYDVNMILRDLPREALERLWIGEMSSWRAKSGGFRHYRLEYVPNRVLRIQQGMYVMRDDDTVWKTVRSCTFWDCFQFFQQSFVKALKDWKAAPVEVIEEIEEMKGKRGTFDEGMEAEVRAYCFKEVELLVGMMDRVAESLDLLDLHLTSWYGAGSIASAMFKKRGVKKHIDRDFAEETTTAIMSAYFGGRIETFGVGLIEEESFNYDVRSAYPAATKELPSLKDCAWEHVSETSRGRIYDPAELWGMWRIRWSLRAGLREQRLAPFPFRHKKRIFWPVNGEGWYHAEEVRAAIDTLSDIYLFDVVEGWLLRPATDEKPLGFIQEIYDERAAYKAAGDAREKPLKLAMNSCYGKFAQSVGGRDGKPPPFQSYFWAGAITADCRAKLLRAAVEAGDDLLAIATDGIFSRSALSLYMGKSLGNWEGSDVEPGLMLIQPGVYASPSLGKDEERTDGLTGFSKTRGFGDKGLNYEAFKAAWLKDGFGAEIIVEETRFIGMGYALATDSLETQWRRWITGEKHIHFSGTSSKGVSRGTRRTNFVELVCPSAPAEMSEVYVPRVKPTLAQAKEWELQSEMVASQPDLEDNPLTWK